MAQARSGPAIQLKLQFTNLLCTEKQGQVLRIVQDFRLLNQHLHIDKYSMKEISECIEDIGRANSSIFTTSSTRIEKHPHLH